MSARERVQAFLSARSRMRGIDHAVVHTVAQGGEHYPLTTADLRSLLEQRPARSKTNMRYSDWDVIQTALMRYSLELEELLETSDEGSALLEQTEQESRQLGVTLGKVNERCIDTYPKKGASDGS